MHRITMTLGASGNHPMPPVRMRSERLGEIARVRTPVASASLSRRWLPTCFALFMLVVTILVAWSVAARLPAVLRDTRCLKADIAAINRQVGLPRAARAAQSERIDTLQDLIGRSHGEAASIENRINAMEREREEQAALAADMERNAMEHRNDVMRHEAELRELLGHELVVHRGPPTRYDAGPEPTAPWYYGPMPTLVSRSFRRKWYAWWAAHQACNEANTFAATTGIELIEVRARIHQINAGIVEFRSRLDDLTAQIQDFRSELRRYTAAPWELLEDLDAKRRELSHTRWMRLFFLIFDMPTLGSCVVMTAAAIARACLIRGSFPACSLARRA